MKQNLSITTLFTQFIRDSETGKRLKKNGEKIKPESIGNYRYVLQNLVQYQAEYKLELKICDASKLNAREFQVEKNYWKKFYRNFTAYLYKKGCHDNYVGANIKVIRTFFNYLKNDRDFATGDFQKMFYVRKEEIEIQVLSPEQLKFLIHDQVFDESLTPALRRIKDIFIFGCITGLRYSDIFLLTNKNFEVNNASHYLKLRSKKTKTFTSIKLPDYAVRIFEAYRNKDSKSLLFSPISLFNFNKSLKQIGELAGFTAPVNVSREKLGKTIQLKKNDKPIRFCDKMSSHMMRRTAITTLLILGLPEHLVRKISGHSANSGSFNRYVHYAQVYLDDEVDKVYGKL